MGDSPPWLDVRRCPGDPILLLRRANKCGMCLSGATNEGGPGVDVTDDEDDALESGGREEDGGNGYSKSEAESVMNGVPSNM
jgi:hypothetical protein